jgi:5'-3' exonuclease|uniref:5'-3' exonuclease domain-containing protein n=1 Tax=viral metagenome TaxID=1070528 RepID=A0A6C0ALZ8_9ZZZZ
MKEVIIIDGSYFCFYRYYAIMNWFKCAKKDEDITNPYDNADFVEKYKKTFVSKIQEMAKKLKMINPTIIVAKDCHRKNIWRMEYYNDYKKNRVYDDSFMGGPFFEMAYKNEELFKNAGVNIIFKHCQLEADDCAALTAKYLTKKYPDINIKIITSDTDYLQLICPNIELFTLKYKKVNTSKNSSGNPKQDLFCKIVSGDKSDCIPSVFPKCGPKTALKYWNDQELFKQKLSENPEYQKRYHMNTILIDMEHIPIHLQSEFNKKLNSIEF